MIVRGKYVDTTSPIRAGNGGVTKPHKHCLTENYLGKIIFKRYHVKILSLYRVWSEHEDSSTFIL